MATTRESHQELLLELEELRLRLQEAEETLEAIRSGGVDGFIVATEQGEEQLYTLNAADRVYRVFLESISQGALTLSSDGLILYANAAAATLLASDGGLAGTYLRAFVRRDERPRFDSLLERGSWGVFSAEIRLRGRKGGRHVYLSLRPLQDRGDKMVVAVLTDLAEQKRTEEVLEAERLARSILEQAGESIVVCDGGGMIIRASRSVAELTGQDPLYRAFDFVLPLLTADGRQRFSLRRGARLRHVRGQEVRLERSDGASFSLILNVDPLRTADRSVVGSIITLTDVTRLKQAEKAREELLRDQERANEELAAIERISRAGLLLANVDQLVHSIVSQVAAAMRADQATLLLAKEGQLELAACVPPGNVGRPFSIAIGSGYAGAIAKMRRSLFIEDVRSSSRVKREELKGQVASLLGAPLICQGDVLGVLHVGWRDKHRADARHQRLLEIIAERAAAAVSVRSLTERLHEQMLVDEELSEGLSAANDELSRIAVTLQENFIHPIPKIAGLEIGTVSQTAYEPELVGGDFSDVFETALGRVAVLIGDVAGKGVRAAGLTETVRSMVRALAAVKTSPAGILGTINDVLLGEGAAGPHITAFLLFLDPQSGHLTYASAGHPPPLLVRASSCRTLPARYGPPLRSFPGDHPEDHITINVDDYLVLYTDGLTEVRRGDDFFEEERLVDAASRLRGRSSQDVAEGLRDAALAFADNLRDDLHVVCLRLR
jgi:PAS domain S-box-containing protein